MCELLAATSKNKIFMNEYLRTFYSHSEEHRNGWGLALLDRSPVFVEKEPVKASDSLRLNEILAQYQYIQNGSTDSERILLYIIDEVNRHISMQEDMSDVNNRIKIIEEVIKSIVPGNKVNLMIYDSEYFYVHKNEAGTMHMREKDGGVILSTQALEPKGWEEVVQNRLLVYKEGELVYEGQSHNDTYIHDEKRMEVLFLQYSGL